MDFVLNNGATVLLILAGVLIGFGALLGLFRGFKRAFIRFLTVALDKDAAAYAEKRRNNKAAKAAAPAAEEEAPKAE